MTIKLGDIDFDLLQVYYSGNCAVLRYNNDNDKPLYIKTSLYDEYSIPNSFVWNGHEFFKNITERSFVKIKMTSNMDDYNSYHNLDKFLDSEQFKTKLIGGINYEYEPIIKNLNNVTTLKYYLPHEKIRIGYPEGPEGIDWNDAFTNFATLYRIYDDEFFEYVKFNYKLNKKINGVSYPCHFNTFDEFTTHMKEGTTVRFIVKPKLLFRNKPGFKNTKIYKVQMNVFRLEIGYR